jgi:hypothetical protein
MTALVELCSGLAALTLHLHGDKPPASRIGAKTGYAHAIADELGLEGPPHRALLVDHDPALCNAMLWLLTTPRILAWCIEDLSGLAADVDPRTIWRHARARRNGVGVVPAAWWWLWTAGARGGIGGFKGRHKHRPNVDGFIPSRRSLIDRIASFQPLPHVDVLCLDIADVKPTPGAVVYIDPEYSAATGYGGRRPSDVAIIAQRWAGAGCRVGVSDRAYLPIPGARHVDLTSRRRGQARRSLTTTDTELLTILEPRS